MGLRNSKWQISCSRRSNRLDLSISRISACRRKRSKRCLTGWATPFLTQNFELTSRKVKRFFALPHETKLLAPHPDSGTHHRGENIFEYSRKHLCICHLPGYSYPGREKVVQLSDSGDESTIAPPSMKESFDCGSENDEFMPNIWLPEGVLPGFNEACSSFFLVTVFP
jgi:hypothetical protein